jgi:hypothetical protein
MDHGPRDASGTIGLVRLTEHRVDYQMSGCSHVVQHCSFNAKLRTGIA